MAVLSDRFSFPPFLTQRQLVSFHLVDVTPGQRGGEAVEQMYFTVTTKGRRSAGGRRVRRTEESKNRSRKRVRT